jgi:hypothetical protein
MMDYFEKILINSTGAVIVLMATVVIYFTYQNNKAWEKFKVDHNCRLVAARRVSLTDPVHVAVLQVEQRARSAWNGVVRDDLLNNNTRRSLCSVANDVKRLTESETEKFRLLCLELSILKNANATMNIF